MSDLVEWLRENPVAYAETAAKELERLRAELADAVKMCDSYSEENQRISDERDRLRAEFAAAQKDAERYRWMRIRCARKGYNLSFTYAAGGKPTDWKPLTEEECDAAIDAELEKEKKE